MSYSDLIAMIVPTYNHSHVVDEVLNTCIEYYKKCGLEVYYYDSSDNDETKKVIDKYISMGYDNLIYVPLEMNLAPVHKRDMVYAGIGLKKRYKYVWLSKDRAWVEESALIEIMQAVEEDYDAIITATRPGDKSFIDSAEELYHRWAPISTSMNTTILNVESILKDFSIPDYSVGYPRYMADFGHYYVLFDGISKLDNPRIARIEMNNRIHISDLAESTWTKDAFIVWKDSWIDVNDALPEMYNPYKDYIIKKVAGLPWILANRGRLMQLHEMGVLTPESLPQVLDRWERISDIPKEVVMAIANNEYNIKYDLSQIQDRSELTKLMVEMTGYIRSGKMSSGQIPIDDLEAAVKSEIVKDEDKPRRNIRVGAAESIINSIKSTDKNGEEIALMFQQLIAYII